MCVVSKRDFRFGGSSFLMKKRLICAHKKRIHQTEFREADIISLDPEDMMKAEAEGIEEQTDYIIWLEQ